MARPRSAIRVLQVVTRGDRVRIEFDTGEHAEMTKEQYYAGMEAKPVSDTERSTTVTARIPPELKLWLRRESVARRISVSAIVRELLVQAQASRPPRVFR